MVFYAAFNSISVISRRQLTLFMLSWVSPVLGWALKCLAQGHSHEKNPEDLVRLEPRTPGLRVKHFTTEPRRIEFDDRAADRSEQDQNVYVCRWILLYTFLKINNGRVRVKPVQAISNLSQLKALVYAELTDSDSWQQVSKHGGKRRKC